MITSTWPNRLNGRIAASDSKSDRARRNRATGAFWNAPGAARSAESRGNNELPGELRFHVLRGHPVERNPPSHRVGGARMPNFPGGDFNGNFRASSPAPVPQPLRRRTTHPRRAPPTPGSKRCWPSSSDGSRSERQALLAFATPEGFGLHAPRATRTPGSAGPGHGRTAVIALFFGSGFGLSPWSSVLAYFNFRGGWSENCRRKSGWVG